MCVIYGTLFGIDQEFYDKQHQLALKRGKNPVSIDEARGRLFHYRVPTNQSLDKYPVALNGEKIAMNGIVSRHKYGELVSNYGDIGYTLDTAYLLAALQHEGFKTLDSLDYVFAFWLIREKSIILANKDYPLFVRKGEIVYFSSFEFEGSHALGNVVLEIERKSGLTEVLYEYENLIYGKKDGSK